MRLRMWTSVWMCAWMCVWMCRCVGVPAVRPMDAVAKPPTVAGAPAPASPPQSELGRSREGGQARPGSQLVFRNTSTIWPYLENSASHHGSLTSFHGRLIRSCDTIARHDNTMTLRTSRTKSKPRYENGTRATGCPTCCPPSRANQPDGWPAGRKSLLG